MASGIYAITNTVTDERVERALRLLDEVERYHNKQEGFIDTREYAGLSCSDLLRIADGTATIEQIRWGHELTPEQLEELERERLAAWQKAGERP